ncbi:hypothetical protein GTU79_08810 [Sodalis ligni]|uniref:hypothetical protein n=1 Tax=Sodalis ligni TaxID=2697027 RepID=UPI00193F5F4E|nr:hypothetical protein [Sodalis ligni]QWA12774.1 hypothetical protein GTU79_08810 [Sodalis ligni]
MNNSKVTRWELINIASNAQAYAKQLHGIICLMMDSREQDDQETWQIAALTTLSHLVCKELEPAVNASVKEPEADHVA